MATIGKVIKNVGSSIFNRTLGRLMGAGISTDSRIVQARAKWSGRSDKKDWRVRLQVPDGPLQKFFDFENNPLMQPLAESNGIFWPLTPAVVIQHSANYNAMDQVHSNYPHQAYQNSQVDSMNIIGEFPVQNQDDARHWVATVNFLRTATKMFFGSDDGLDGLKGNPPPIMHLYGYGDHMFNKVPVVINTFNVELRPGIDYISTKQGSKGDLAKQDFISQQQSYLNSGLSYDPYTGRPINMESITNASVDGFDSDSQTWAPTLSNISVLVTPIYSRDSIKNFSMKKFVNGELNGKGRNEVGFI
jgi:hypothetical protein|tara:strand:- start:274 stop:1182 length:909 start_codon:yes stop_codon:yes gene_type:complete